MKKILRIRLGLLVILVMNFIFFDFLSLHAQEVKIVKVLDSNLFETKSGQRIRLANVLTPSISDSNKKLALFAMSIKKYAEEQFLGRPLIMKIARTDSGKSEPIPVHLFQKFMMKTVCYNKLYLERGYGKFIEEADTTYRAEYLAAQEKAKRKKRGIWSEKLYLPETPKIYAYSLMIGFGNYHSLNGFYKEVLLTSEPIGNTKGLRLRMAALFARRAIENDGYRNGLETIWFNPYWAFNGKYMGVEPGAIIFSSPDEELEGMVLDFFILPMVKLKVGLMDRVYLSFDFLTDVLYSLNAFGINFYNAQPYLKIWMGYSPVDEERRIVSFKMEGLISRKFLIKFQGISFLYKPANERTFGWRLGIGYVFH